MDDRPRFTAKDARELAGLSYRQLNDWEGKGAAPADRDAEGGWRKFTPKQIFALMVSNEIRRLYGTPLEKLRYVSDFMMHEDADHLAVAIRLMKVGLHVFLLTDLEETFVMDSDLEFEELVHNGLFRVEETRPYIFLRLNDVVNRLLAATKNPVRLEAHERAYQSKWEVDAALRVQTTPELDLLRAVRSGRHDRIEVTIKDGKIRHLNAEGDAEAGDIDVEDDAVNVTRRGDFETFSFTACDGRVVKARRTLPKRYSDDDNKPVLFAVRLRTNPEPPARGRDGQQPSDSAKIKTTDRRDRKSLSCENHARKRVPDAQPRKMPTDTRR